MKKFLLLFALSTLVIYSCATFQSVVKATFPYTTTLTIPRSAPVGVEQSVTEKATSFDETITRSGSNTDKIHEVRIVSAALKSRDPSDFNIGNLRSVRFYIQSPNEKEEVMIASRTDITPTVGNSIVLDINDTKQIDEYLHERELKIRMAYTLRNHIDGTAHLHLSLGLHAQPNK